MATVHPSPATAAAPAPATGSAPANPATAPAFRDSIHGSAPATAPATGSVPANSTPGSAPEPANLSAPAYLPNQVQ